MKILEDDHLDSQIAACDRLLKRLRAAIAEERELEQKLVKTQIPQINGK